MENDETLTEIQAQNKNKNILCGFRILDFFYKFFYEGFCQQITGVDWDMIGTEDWISQHNSGLLIKRLLIRFFN